MNRRNLLPTLIIVAIQAAISAITIYLLLTSS